MFKLSDIHYIIMQLLAECGWASKSTFDQTGYSYTYLKRNIRALLDAGYIKKRGKGARTMYALTSAGGKCLQAHNQHRYRPEMLEINRRLSRSPDRAVLRGDCAVLFSLAGYNVHPDDKPELPADCQCSADGEGGTYHDPNDVDSGVDGVRGIQGARAVHAKCDTAVGCYYDATQIKALAVDKEGSNYSRACGVLVTSDRVFRVYHSRDVAMKYGKTGEKNFIKEMHGAFHGMTALDTEGILVFGYDFTAAEHILDNYLYPDKRPKPSSRKDKNGKEILTGEMLTPNNLGNPAYYLPMDSCPREYLQMFRYPSWEDAMNQLSSWICLGLVNQTKWCYTHEGRTVYVLASLDLNHIQMAVRAIKNQPQAMFTILCMGWQAPLMRHLLTPYSKQNIVVKCLSEDFSEVLLAHLHGSGTESV